MDKLRFGTAGIPISTRGDTLQGIKDVRKLGLDSFEMEFVRGINIKEEKTSEIKNISQKTDIILTAHSPYWINLNSNEKEKYNASISYIVNSAKILSLCKGHSVCFHAGYYQKQDPKKVYEKIRGGIKEIVVLIKEFDKELWISPEVSGKISQFGDVDELIKLSQDIEQVMPCIDFSHNFSRSIGQANRTEDFKNILNKIKDKLGKDYLERMHIHVSGIAFGDKGERHHLTLEESSFNYKDLLKTLKEFNVRGVLISESPNIENDALKMKNYYSKL